MKEKRRKKIPETCAILTAVLLVILTARDDAIAMFVTSIVILTIELVLFGKDLLGKPLATIVFGCLVAFAVAVLMGAI